MAKNQINMNSVSLPSVPKAPVAGANAGFDFDDNSSKQRRQNLMGEMPSMAEVDANESMTSAGRLDQMLQSGSPLMERAKTQGKQSANSRGLLNSSMAAGAAQGAMIDRAQPFALQDSNNLMQNARQNADAENQQNMLQSSTLADSFLNNQQFQQQSALQSQDYNIRSNLQEQQSGLQAQQEAQQFGYEQALTGQQAEIQEQRDNRLAELDRQQTQLQADLTEAQAQNDFGRQQQLNEQSAALQQERDELLFSQDLDRTAQEYGLRSEMLEQEGQQAMENLYGTSLANAWGVMGNNVTDIVAQSMIEINDIQSNPNIDADDKTDMIEQIKSARDSDVEFQAELYSTLPDTLQNTNVFPDSVG